MAVTDPRLRADAARNLERIQSAARECFTEQGLDVSVAEIARRAGVGKATFFRRYPTKDALIAAMLDSFLGELERMAAEAATDPDPTAGLRSFLVACIRMQSDNAGFFDAIAQRLPALEPAPQLAERCLAACATVLEPAQRAGTIRAEAEPGDVMAMLKMLGTAARPAPGAPAPEEVWQRYLDLLLAGLAPGGPPLCGRPYEAGIKRP
jgi:AcrR family transcriptional regulator